MATAWSIASSTKANKLVPVARLAAMRLRANGSPDAALPLSTVVELFVGQGEEPAPNRDVGPLSLRSIMGRTAGLADDGAQLRHTAAMSIVEVRNRKTGE
jgi:hypothetical protein